MKKENRRNKWAVIVSLLLYVVMTVIAGRTVVVEADVMTNVTTIIDSTEKLDSTGMTNPGEATDTEETTEVSEPTETTETSTETTETSTETTKPVEITEPSGITNTTEPIVEQTLNKPEKIKGLMTVGISKKSAKISWKKAEGVSQYYIYRKEASEKKYKLLSKTTKCSYKDNTLVYDKLYYYKVVAEAVVDQKSIKGSATTIRYVNKEIVADDHQKYSYAEMKSDIEELVKKYGGLVRYEIIGTSQDGRNIYDVIIGNENVDRTLLVTAALHAREYMTSLLCMNQIEYYLENYNKKIAGRKVKDVLKEIEIHYIVMANPDGVTISQYGIKKIRSKKLRKLLSKIDNSYMHRWKANARGVDLNKNFPSYFKINGKAGSQGYSGKKAGSESETKAVIKLLKQLKNKNLQGVVNYHAMGSIIFGDCQIKGKMKKNTERMYALAREITGYSSSAGYYSSSRNKSSGNFREYCIYNNKIPSITLEIGRYTCPGPISEFPSIWQKNRDVVIREAMLFV